MVKRIEPQGTECPETAFSVAKHPICFRGATIGNQQHNSSISPQLRNLKNAAKGSVKYTLSEIFEENHLLSGFVFYSHRFQSFLKKKQQKV
jgi:hypothetical protein